MSPRDRGLADVERPAWRAFEWRRSGADGSGQAAILPTRCAQARCSSRTKSSMAVIASP